MLEHNHSCPVQSTPRIPRSDGRGCSRSSQIPLPSSGPQAPENPKPMALAAARRLSSTTTAAAAPKLSSIFRNPKRRSPPTNISSLFGDRKHPSPPPASGDEPLWRRPRPKLRVPWEEEAGVLRRRLHEGQYLPGPDFSSAPHAVLPDTVKAAAERFGHDNQVVAK